MPRTTKITIRRATHPAVGGTCTLLKKTVYYKDYYSADGSDGPWFRTIAQAIESGERHPGGMAYTMPDGTLKVVTL